MEDNPQLNLFPDEELERLKKKGKNDDFLTQINEEVYGPPKIGRSKGWKELYPNANLSLVPETETIIPGPPPESPEVNRLADDKKDDDGYKHAWQRIHNR